MPWWMERFREDMTYGAQELSWVLLRLQLGKPRPRQGSVAPPGVVKLAWFSHELWHSDLRTPSLARDRVMAHLCLVATWSSTNSTGSSLAPEPSVAPMPALSGRRAGPEGWELFWQQCELVLCCACVKTQSPLVNSTLITARRRDCLGET